MPKHFSQHDFRSIPILGVRIEALPEPPDTPVEGRLWYDTVNSVLKVYNGASWVRADGADIPDGTIADEKIAADAGIALSKLAIDPLDRANHTGSQPASTISDLDAVVKAYRLDQFAKPNAALDVNGQRITNVGVPSNNTDVATKQYVDDARAGLSVKDPVKVVAQVNIDLASPGASIDGVAMSADDRFLAANQTDASENGIYLWKGASVAAVRAPDADAAGEIVDGSVLAVAQGTDAGSQYIQTATPGGSPGTWAQDWTKYTVGAGGGGVQKYSGTIPALTAGAYVSITHGLNTQDITVSVRDATSHEAVAIDWKSLDANTVQVRADVAVPANTLRIVVVG